MKNLTLEQLDAGIDALTDNASSLIAEAELLHERGYFARAYTLGHLAREELAKVTMLLAAGIRLIVGHEVDWEGLRQRFVNHKSKLRQDTLWNLMSSGAVHTEKGEDYLKLMEAVISGRNDAKNNSLYVGFRDGKFAKPAEVISAETAMRTIQLARMSCEEWITQRRATGKLVDREPGSMRDQFQDLPKLLKVDSFEEMLQLLRTGSVLMEMIREKLGEERKDSGSDGQSDKQ
jgi:AbiV family abortive infection protein